MDKTEVDVNEIGAAQQPVFDSRERAGICSTATASRLGSTHRHFQMVIGVSFAGSKSDGA
jgi:hypothetical protein